MDRNGSIRTIAAGPCRNLVSILLGVSEKRDGSAPAGFIEVKQPNFHTKFLAPEALRGEWET